MTCIDKKKNESMLFFPPMKLDFKYPEYHYIDTVSEKHRTITNLSSYAAESLARFQLTCSFDGQTFSLCLYDFDIFLLGSNLHAPRVWQMQECIGFKHQFTVLSRALSRRPTDMLVIDYQYIFGLDPHGFNLKV